ncbi:MAG: phospholipase D family protein, partial [Candidatus Micrarchaeota archaeon]|nr:phospholipase D family protein [Candidatus Micrarchaeota archaeon]
MLDFRSFALGFLLCLALAGLGAMALGLGVAAPTYSNAPPAVAAPAAYGNAPTAILASGNNTVEPLFSPGSGERIVSLINSAQHSIDVEMYEMTPSSGLPQALAAAQARGVAVRLILEPRVNSNGLASMVSGLSTSGVSVKWASLKYTLTHSKIMIIDGHIVLVGSINFSKAAQYTNREADVILD